MATNQQKATFKHMMDALGGVENLLRKVAESRENQAFRGEAEANLRTCRTIKQIVQSTFAETEKQAVGQLAAEAALAMEEIERRPRPGMQLRCRPTFIIGYRRSGTTLLSWLLDSHPNVAAVPENTLCYLLLGEDEVERPEILERPIEIVRAYHNLEELGEMRAQFFRRIAQLIDGVFSDYAARLGKKRWVEKELFLARSVDLLDAVFGYNAQFIYVVRHGLDVAYSASERFGWRLGTPIIGEGSHNLRNYLRYWAENNELFADFHECNRDRCLLVRYEELVTRPEPVARRIFEFLGEPCSPTSSRRCSGRTTTAAWGTTRSWPWAAARSTPAAASAGRAGPRPSSGNSRARPTPCSSGWATRPSPWARARRSRRWPPLAESPRASSP